MNYENVCKKLEELMVELMQKGITIPQQLFDDLKSGRTLASVYNTELTDPEAEIQAAPYLQKAEYNLLFLAESEAGKEYADEWQNKISRAYTGEGGKATYISRFVSGIPKGEYWIRIKASELTNDDELSKLLDVFHITARPENDGYLLVYGRKEDISLFLKEVRRKVGKNASVTSFSK